MGNVYDFKKYIGGIGMDIFTPKKTADELVSELLEQHGIYSVPVDPLIIAEAEGVKVYNAEFGNDDIHGAIRKLNDEIVEIFVKDSDIPTRKRFTIAHELGHYFLHLDSEKGKFVDNVNTLFRNPKVRDVKERQANQFAAALLMPRDLIESHWDICYSIDRMAQIFNVSYTSMEFRLKNLGLI